MRLKAEINVAGRIVNIDADDSITSVADLATLGRFLESAAVADMRGRNADEFRLNAPNGLVSGRFEDIESIKLEVRW